MTVMMKRLVTSADAPPIERPIIMSAPMVQAILAGRKTQARRIVKPQPPDDCGRIEVGSYCPTVVDRHGEEQPGPETFGAYSVDGEWGLRCPYGAPGDRLWVRETWAAGQTFRYRADGGPAIYGGWRSPVHMHRAASRLTLEIEAVRVERVQEISEDDCTREGVWTLPPIHERGCTGIELFAHLWDSLSAKRAPWLSDPWVWVVTFRRLA